MKKIIFILLFLIFSPKLCFADIEVYTDISTCTIYYNGEKISEEVMYNGKKACAQKMLNTSHFGVKCPDGYTLRQMDSITHEDPEYQKYNKIFYCSRMLSTNVDYVNICANKGVSDVFVIIGRVIQIVKWVVPFIIIVLGMVDFGKAIVSDDEKSNQKALSSLVKRLLSGVIIFFIPTIVLAILNLVDLTRGIEKEYNTKFGGCTRCLFDPSECEVNE